MRSPKHRERSQLTVKSDEDNWLQPLILLNIKFWGPYVVIAYYQTDQDQAQKKYSSNAAKSNNSEH